MHTNHLTIPGTYGKDERANACTYEHVDKKHTQVNSKTLSWARIHACSILQKFARVVKTSLKYAIPHFLPKS
jgi:hypothetical protein